MKKTIKTNPVFLIVVIAGLAMTGYCGVEIEGEAPADIIQIALAGGPYRVALEEIIESYQKLHPNIQIRLNVISSSYQTWIRTRIAAGGDLMPDIYNGHFISGCKQKGKLVALDKYLDSVNPYTGKRWCDTFNMELAMRYRYAGRIYDLPIDYIEISMFYNKDIFKRLGLSEPETWEELLETCRKLKHAGYIPITISADTESFWLWSMGWLVRMFGDAYMRDIVPLVAARPGDWDYEPKWNENYRYDPNDPYSDMMVAISKERLLNAILQGEIDFRSEKFKSIYRKLKELSQYFQKGFLGTHFGQEGGGLGNAVKLFYAQKAAMCILSSISVTGILLDFEKMPQAERFDFGNFWFPPITSDRLCAGPFRGVGGGGNILAVANKGEPVHEKNVVDFLMYLTTPESGRILIERTLDDEQALVGPLLIKDVELPKDLHDKFSVFMGHGFEKLNFRGLEDEQESAGEWVVAAQEYFAGRTSLEEFLNRYQEIMLNAIPRLQKRDGLDLDPRTKDIPPKVSCRKNKLNPFENGSLMLLIIILLFSVLALWHISRSKGIARSHTKMAYLLLLPTFMLLATFNYIPALSGLYHAFTDWEEGRKAVFCGFDNFVKLASDEVFFRGLWNISILLVTALLKNTLVPFLAAELILALVSSRLRYIFRTAFLIPMVVPAMVIILIWRFVYDPNMGMLNQALAAIGLERFCLSWLGEPSLALGAIVFMGFPWIGALGLLIYMAGLMRIPSSVIEAYRIESSSIFRRVWNIDIPLVRGQTRLLIILTFIGTIQDFQTILIMTRGGPGLATYVPALRMYYQAFTYSHFGYGAAIGFVLFAAILILTLFTQKLIKPTVEF